LPEMTALLVRAGPLLVNATRIQVGLCSFLCVPPRQSHCFFSGYMLVSCKKSCSEVSAPVSIVQI
jgi:hypothetical protein